MANKRRPLGYWSIFENCFNDAQKYKSRSEWGKNSSRAVQSAKDNEWYIICTQHMKLLIRPNGTLTKEFCHEKALECKNDKEFKIKYPSERKAVHKNGWAKEICSHFVKLGSKYSRALYVFEHPDNSVYIGLTYNYDERYRQHMNKSQILIEKKALGGQKFIKLDIFYLKDIAAVKEDELIEEYRANGWIILNKHKGGGLGGNNLKWTKEACIKDASSCKTKKEWREKSPGATAAAYKNKWIKECCAHMIENKAPHGYWVKDKCLNISKKFSSRKEWQTKHSKSYDAAVTYKWLDECCAHMKPSKSAKKKIQCIETNEIFESINGASRKLKISRGNLSSVLLGNRNKAGKLTFKYL